VHDWSAATSAQKSSLSCCVPTISIFAHGLAAGTDQPVVEMDIDKEVSKFARSAATTFAPRASGATGKNPAYRGSVLYNVFEVQAWAALVVGGLLSFNIIFPSDQPDIARLLGMWSIW
jgi:hypothetical protein